MFSTISHSVVDSQSLLLQIFLFKTLITDKNVFNRDGSMWRSSKRCGKSFLERTGDFSNESLFYSLSICLGLKRPKMMLSSITRPFSLKQGMDRFSLAVLYVTILVKSSYSFLRLAGFGKINPQTGSISRSQIVSPREDESKVQVIRQDPYVDEVLLDRSI